MKLFKMKIYKVPELTQDQETTIGNLKEYKVFWDKENEIHVIVLAKKIKIEMWPNGTIEKVYV